MRKISANYIFPIHTQPIKNGVLTIDEVGKIVELSAFGDTGKDVEFYDGIICPGFVNAHCHIELSHMKGVIPQHSGMTAFCKSVISYRHSDISEQMSAMYAADKLMENEGIVAVGDISNNDLSAQMKSDSRLIYHTFVETLNLNPCFAEENIAKARNIKQTFANKGLRVSITPHAPYSLSERLFELSVAEGNNSGIISIHNEESFDEMDVFAKKQGKMRDFFGTDMDAFLSEYDNPLRRILKYIDSDTSLLLIHNTHTNERDFQQVLTRNRKPTWVLCPSSNLYIENHLPPIEMLRRKNAKIATGTDSLASNTNLSIIKELITVSDNFENIELNELLTWATVNGAEALGIEKQFGTFEKGKTPGIVLIDNINTKKMMLTSKSTSRIL
ncbi:MAG: amidohydrolase family protein [Prevotellaceae bacterium]|jgi:cytosine/adenosine deaminase-related metal-dependent hydrolase|nr:amidohydrolase family protein [Prevotellaceae bacterium]